MNAILKIIKEYNQSDFGDRLLYNLVRLSAQSERKGLRPPETGLGQQIN